MEIMKRTDEVRVETEEEAKALVEKFKESGKVEGYDVIKYSIVLKEKKSKGEVIDSYYLVTIVMRW